MRILCTSNPLVGHWLPMLPLARAAQEAGHEVVIATGPDAVPEIERRGFTAWSIGSDLETIQTGLRSRPRSPAETDEERTIADGLAMFADPAIARARDLLDRTADWGPDMVVQEIYELGGTYIPAHLHVLHGLGAHYPNFIKLAELALAHVRTTLGEPARRVPMADTPYVDPFDFAVPLEALRELPVNVVLTCGYDVDPAAFEPLPRNVAVERWVSQALLLPKCSAVICHAGAGTLMGALAYGLPVVCLPRGADQFANAAQVARTGAGITLLPDQGSVESIRDATHRVLDEASYSAAARKLRSEIELLPIQQPSSKS